jgi:hypothetical protein
MNVIDTKRMRRNMVPGNVFEKREESGRSVRGDTESESWGDKGWNGIPEEFPRAIDYKLKLRTWPREGTHEHYFSLLAIILYIKARSIG